MLPLERAIQDEIWSRRDNFGDLLLDLPGEGDPHTNDELPFVADLLRSVQRRRGLHKATSLCELSLFGNEVPLGFTRRRPIRADFLAHTPGESGLTVVELKRSDKTARQALTEMLAYGQWLTTRFPPMSTADIDYLLISPMNASIVREAVLHTSLFDRKTIHCLVPELGTPGDISTLKLRYWPPPDDAFGRISAQAFDAAGIGIRQIAWRGAQRVWCGDEQWERDNRPAVARRMGQVVSLAAQLMENANIHGFCFASRYPQELNLMFPNVLTIGAINPYRAARAHAWKSIVQNHGDRFDPEEHVPDAASDPLNFSNFIPGLKDDHADLSGQPLHEAETMWDMELYRLGKRVVEAALVTPGTTSVEERWSETSGMHLGAMLASPLEYGLRERFEARTTGIVRDLMIEHLTRTSSDDPLAVAEFDAPVLDSVTSIEKVLRFLEEMYETADL
ncbi:hypothetical protein [Alienimonas chondri]|uniref:hypothetical protein n=1 Tax=Alienimonas chondri TaxID=2681879 RepID=UPI0014890DE7|nr:hypothetical protein [Alienimonas chondri]